ncbi:MAG: gliding motility-associated ABC transporter substrate-binding protein GldG [Puia sp.]|nr:gliding motility-associated ABC transporter substrate-binding protein GldG [Puia sp.]
MIFSSKYGWVLLLVFLTALNGIASLVHCRIDLTAEKRYTLSEATKKLLSGLDGDITIDFFLQGNLNAGVKKLSNNTIELLQEFRDYSHGRVRFRTFDPLSELADTAQSGFLDSLRRMGIEPNTQVVQTKKGDEQSQRIIIPGAIVKYEDRIFPVDLLKGVQRGQEGQSPEQLYTNAETLLEYKFANAIEKITRKTKPAVGYVMGNGEPLDFSVYNLIQGLRTEYRFGVVRLDSLPFIPSDYNALIIVKPTEKFTDAEKLKLDQYLMHGGNLVWMVDALHAELDDSLMINNETVAYDRGLNLEDLFFRYGVRINPDLVLDMQSASINFVTGMQGDKPQMSMLTWPYYPLLNGSLTHPISKNLDPVYAKFANSIDTVKSPGIEKTILLQSSKNGRIVGTPALITLESLKTANDASLFTRPDIPVAVLLEGHFTSLYTGRLSSAMADTLTNVYHRPFLATDSVRSRVLVCADADIVMNDVARQGPLPMGFNKDISYRFANQDFIDNSLDYILNPSGILETRAKDFTLRLLDPKKVEQDHSFWQFVNIVLPIGLVILLGFLFQWLRKRKYSGE